MKATSKEFRLQADSHKDIVRGFEEATDRIELSYGKFRRRRLKPAHLLNALVRDFVALPEAQRVAVGVRVLRDYESSLEWGQSPPVDGGDGGLPPPTGLPLEMPPGHAGRPKKRRS